jgi:sodium/hydrogen antiporter
VLAILVFAVTLLAAVLLSGLAKRSVLSTAVLFLVAGIAVGDGVLGLVCVQASDPVVSGFAELALVSVLYTEGMRLTAGELRRVWRLPGRALLLGMPLTLAAAVLLGRLVTGLSWGEAFLVGAILSPTDPVFATALVGRSDVPERLRHLLNVESGFNDGLALPIVFAGLTLLAPEPVDWTTVGLELVFGVGIGIAVPLAAVALENSPLFHAEGVYEPLNGLAIGLLVLAICSLTHANEFLGAFAAGITLATCGPRARESFSPLGEQLSEVLKLAALLIFGALIAPSWLGSMARESYVFAGLVLVAARPLAIELALVGSQLTQRERLVAAWFGPKGFASVFFGLLVLKSEVPDAVHLFHLVAIVIAGSIVAHSSTDVLVARWFAKRPDASPAAQR